MTNYTKHAIKGTAIVFVVSILAGFLGYVVRLVLARNLSVEDFGLFYAIFAFLALLGVFKSLGFERSLIKFIPEFQHKNKNDFIKSSMIYVTVIQFITNSIIIVAVYLLSNYLSINFFHTPKANIILKLMTIAFFIDSFVNTLKFSFQGFQKMTLFAGIDTLRMIIILVIIFIGFKLNYGVFSPIAAYMIAPIILLIVFGWILLNKVFPNFIISRFIIDRNLLKKISKYSIFVMVSGTAAIILGYTDTMVLTYFSGVTAVAMYNVALPTAKILIYLPTAIGSILLPLTSELWARKKEKLLIEGMDLLYKYTFIIVLPLVFIMLSFSELLILVFFGKNYILASMPMRILSIGMIFYTMHLINVNFFLGIGHPEIQSKILYIAAAFNLVTDLVLIPLFGTIGAAITTSLSLFIMMTMGLVYVKRFIMIKFHFNMWMRVLLAGIIFIFIIVVLKKIIYLNLWVETSIVLALAGMVYTILLFLLKIVYLKEVKDLYNRIFN